MFDPAAARRGREVFDGQGKCATCHVPPTFTEPGWNLHPAKDINIDDFQSGRSPDDAYRTAPLAGRLFWRTRGYYHDGRFPDLMSVVNHYDAGIPGANNGAPLGLSDQQKADLVEYLKSI
jgi:cytochrome c peroxidase